MINYNEIWLETINQLKENVPKSALSFFENITFVSVENGVLNLTVPSPFIMANLSTQKDLIINTFSEKAGEAVSLSLTVNSKIKAKAPTIKSDDKEKSTQKIERQSLNTTLNKKYTFDNFVSGDNSELAFKAANIIANNPGVSFNPCLIYGEVGLGKTHLLQAIGNYIDEHSPRTKIIYTTAESFTNEFINSLNGAERNTAKNKFKQKYRNVDVLLLDDIHFLQNKDGTQEELFHTFNDLYEKNKQIVFTCDRPITELKNITDRLKSRFTRGLNVDLKPPQYEVRVAIARQKCKELELDIPEDTLDFICQSVRTNVRELEGALTTVSAIKNIIGKKVTIEIAKEHIKDFIVEPTFKNTEYTIDDIFNVTSNYFNVSLVDLKGNSRSKNIKNPRQIAIYISYKYGKFTQSEIGNYLNKDHTSIGYTIKTIEPLVEIDDSIQNAIKEIKLKLEEK